MSKIQIEQMFDIDARRNIYSFIKKNPGLHFREVSRELDIPASTLKYHLNYLIKKKILLKQKDNGYLRYYSSDKVSNGDKKLLSILRETVPRNIVLYLFLYSDSSNKEIMDFAEKWKNHPTKIGYHLNKHRTTISFHIKKLLEENILESFTVKNEVRYRLKNPEDIIDLIIKYKKSILSEAYGRFLKYLENPRNDNKNNSIDNALDALFDIFPLPFRS